MINLCLLSFLMGSSLNAACQNLNKCIAAIVVEHKNNYMQLSSFLIAICKKKPEMERQN